MKEWEQLFQDTIQHIIESILRCCAEVRLIKKAHIWYLFPFISFLSPPLVKQYTQFTTFIIFPFLLKLMSNSNNYKRLEFKPMNIFMNGSFSLLILNFLLHFNSYFQYYSTLQPL